MEKVSPRLMVSDTPLTALTEVAGLKRELEDSRMELDSEKTIRICRAWHRGAKDSWHQRVSSFLTPPIVVEMIQNRMGQKSLVSFYVQLTGLFFTDVSLVPFFFNDRKRTENW